MTVLQEVEKNSLEKWGTGNRGLFPDQVNNVIRAPGECMNEKSKQHKQKKHSRVGEPYLVTRAVTHIRLIEVNAGKLVALEALASVYLALSQKYVTLFCTTEPPTNCVTHSIRRPFQSAGIGWLSCKPQALRAPGAPIGPLRIN